jgi:hypothetical protein
MGGMGVVFEWNRDDAWSSTTSGITTPLMFWFWWSLGHSTGVLVPQLLA